MSSPVGAVSQLAYLGFEVSDLGAWDQFVTRLLGFEVTEVPGGLALRYDDYAYRILLRQGPADDLAFLGWQVEDAASFDAIVDQLRAAGVTVREDAALAEQRWVGRLAAFDDPAGNPTELVLGPMMGKTPFATRKVPMGFAAGDRGMGHLALTARTRQESETFYTEHLGLRLSDRIQVSYPQMDIDIAFLRANRRHHSVAVGGPLGKRMHHFMVQLESQEDVGRVFDRAWRAGRVANLIGQHPNDQMLSFYLRTPSGFQLEIGCDGVEVDEDAWDPTTHTRIAIWGHQPIGARQEHGA